MTNGKNTAIIAPANPVQTVAPRKGGNRNARGN